MCVTSLNIQSLVVKYLKRLLLDFVAIFNQAGGYHEQIKKSSNIPK